MSTRIAAGFPEYVLAFDKVRSEELRFTPQRRTARRMPYTGK